MGQSNLQAIDYYTLNANSMASAKKSLWAGVRSGNTPVFAIYAGENTAILDSPNNNLSEIFFHTNYDYLRVKSILDFTINFPTRAKRENTSAGKKSTTNIVSYNGFADSWIADLPASVLPASATVPPAMFTVFVKNNSSSGSIALSAAKDVVESTADPAWTYNYNGTYLQRTTSGADVYYTKYNEDLIQYLGWDKPVGYYYYTIPGNYYIQWGTGSVYSSQGYYNNTYVSGRTAHSTARSMMGISTSPTANDSYNTLNYAWYFDLGVLRIYESGVNAQTFTTSYSVNDRFTITHDGSFVRYYQNNKLMRIVAVGNATFYLDTAFLDIGSSLTSLRIGQLSSLNTKKNLDGSSFGGTIPVQVLSPENFRLATIYNDGEHLVVRERYQCYGQDLPAISIQCRAYFYGQTQGVLAYSGLYAVHSPASFNDNTPYDGTYWRRIYTTINFSTSNSGEYFDKVEIQRTGGAKPVSSILNWVSVYNRATNYHYIDQVNGSAIAPTDPYNTIWYTAYYGAATQSFSMRVFTEHPYTGSTYSASYSPRWIVKFTNTSTGLTFEDVVGGIHWFRKWGA